LPQKFAIGQTVRFAPSNTRNTVAGNYEIRQLMPASDYQAEPRYRIKHASERHERIVTESDLMPWQEATGLEETALLT
jgi:hypothetical protein